MSNLTAADENNSTFKGEQSRAPAGVDVFLAAMNIFLSITTSVGNALILIALLKVTSIYPSTKLLFRCLAVTDLCVGLISQPLLAVFLMRIQTDTDVTGAVLIVSTVVLCGVSILVSTAISVDRLLALYLGLRYRHVLTLRRVRAVIICFWLLSFALGGWLRFGKDTVLMTVLVFIVLITLCLLISLCSNIKIYLRLHHHQNQSQPHVHQAQPANEGEIPLNIARYKRTVSSIAWVQLALLACYLPFSVYGMLLLFGGITLPEAGILFVFSLLYLNSSLNPLLYCWKIREVRQAVKDTIRQLNCCAST
ncbi:adenosine receptor A3-like [Oculina patagonica]